MRRGARGEARGHRAARGAAARVLSGGDGSGGRTQTRLATTGTRTRRRRRHRTAGPPHCRDHCAAVACVDRAAGREGRGQPLMGPPQPPRLLPRRERRDGDNRGEHERPQEARAVALQPELQAREQGGGQRRVGVLGGACLRHTLRRHTLRRGVGRHHARAPAPLRGSRRKGRPAVPAEPKDEAVADIGALAQQVLHRGRLHEQTVSCPAGRHCRGGLCLNPASTALKGARSGGLTIWRWEVSFLRSRTVGS